MLSLLAIGTLTLSQCASPDRPRGGSELTTVNGQGSVTVLQGTTKLRSYKTASPNIEETRFVDNERQLVVKSRGNHGPATVQLFDLASGAEKGRVMAYEIKDGNPDWAAGMGE